MSFVELDSVLETPVALVLGARSPSGLPAIGRLVGMRRCADGELVDILVSRAQWAEAAAGLVPGAAAAVTMCRPSDYRTFQIKGVVEATTPADGADHAFAEAYRDSICTVFEALAVRRSQIGPWLSTKDLIRVRLRPTSMYRQTPGPGAGQPVERAAP